MKKLFITFIAIISLVVLGVICVVKTNNDTQNNYLRIHIRANSNEDIDQGVKYAVKESIVLYLTPKIGQVDSVEEAMEILESELINIQVICDKVLEKNGFNYNSKAKLAQEDFPTRSYNDLVLDSGIYDALIIELGTGTGDNWWCVVYPPLCFVAKEDNGDETVKYKSLIYELIKN